MYFICETLPYLYLISKTTPTPRQVILYFCPSVILSNMEYKFTLNNLSNKGIHNNVEKLTHNSLLVVMVVMAEAAVIVMVVFVAVVVCVMLLL